MIILDLTTSLNLPSIYSKYLGICLAGGTGDILSNFGSRKFSEHLLDIKNTVQISYNYSNYDTTLFSTPNTNLTTKTNNYLTNI